MADGNVDFCFWCYIHDHLDFYDGSHKCRYDALSGAHSQCVKCEDFVRDIRNRQAGNTSRSLTRGSKKTMI